MPNELPSVHPGETRAVGMSDPSAYPVVISPSDTELTPRPRAFMVDEDCTINFTGLNLDNSASAVDGWPVKAGVVYPIRLTKIRAVSSGRFLAIY